MRSEEGRSEHCQCSAQCHPQCCDAEYKSKCTAPVAMVSKERLRVIVAYRIALIMGQEVHSVAEHHLQSRKHLFPSITFSPNLNLPLGTILLLSITFLRPDFGATGDLPPFLSFG